MADYKFVVSVDPTLRAKKLLSLGKDYVIPWSFSDNKREVVYTRDGFQADTLEQFSIAHSCGIVRRLTLKIQMSEETLYITAECL